MNGPSEIISDLWLFQDEKSGANCCVVLKGRVAMVVASGAINMLEDDTWRDFINGRGASIGAFIFLGSHGESGWEPNRAVFTVDTKLVPFPSYVFTGDSPGAELPITGWELLSPYGPARPMVYNTVERTLFCGDMLSDTDIPLVLWGSQEYLDSIERVERLDAKLIVPSRGTPAIGKRDIRGRIERDRTYITALRNHVETSRRAGISLDRAQQVARSVYEDYPFVEQHVENVRFVWDESG